jgi:hypothetical protein
MARKSAAAEKTKRRVRTNQLLVYIDPSVAKALKRLAIEQETTASALVEKACRQLLAKSRVAPGADSED